MLLLHRQGECLTDSKLVSGLRRQDPAAFQMLCDIHLSSVWRYVYGRVQGNEHLAEDIVSETLISLIDSVDSLDANCNLGGWLRTVAANRPRLLPGHCPCAPIG